MLKIRGLLKVRSLFNLDQLGYHKSYKEVQCYERSTALTFKQHNVNVTPSQKVQFMADNVDHNPCNLDGKNTVHWPIFSDDTFRIVPRNDVQMIK